MEQPDTFVVHYSILDRDTYGRAPSDPQFDKSTKSCLHKIAKSGNKVGWASLGAWGGGTYIGICGVSDSGCSLGACSGRRSLR